MSREEHLSKSYPNLLNALSRHPNWRSKRLNPKQQYQMSHSEHWLRQVEQCVSMFPHYHLNNSIHHLLKDRLFQLLPTMKDPVVLTVDLGFAKKGRNLAAELGVPIAFIEKRRQTKTNAAQALSLIGDTTDRDVIIVDDEVDTGGSMAEAAKVAQKNGAREIFSVFVHPVFSGPAIEKLAASPITHLITTNTVPVAPEGIKTLRKKRKVDILNIAPLLGEVIRRAHEGRSVGEMFDE